MCALPNQVLAPRRERSFVMKRIAAVDDDGTQLRVLQGIVNSLGHVFHGYPDGKSFFGDVQSSRFDLLIVDWSLPDEPGVELVRRVRRDVSRSVPILMLTYRAEEHEIVQGLSSGADDYVIKTMRLHELRARIAALLRRADNEVPVEHLVFGNYQFHLKSRRLTIGDDDVALSVKEYDLALLLFRHVDVLLPRSYLVEAALGPKADATARTLDVYVSRLRAKLRLWPQNGVRLVSTYGQGYRLETVLDGFVRED